MTDKVLIVLSCGTDNPNRATRALFFAMVAKKSGKDTAVFLLDEGVYLAKKGIVDNLQAAPVTKPMITCRTCRNMKSRYMSAHHVPYPGESMSRI